MANLYTIGVRMVMHDQASSSLAALASHFIGIHHHIGLATAAAARFQVGVTGVATAMLGGGILKAQVHMLEAGSKLVGVQNQMTAAGWKQKEIAEATAEAYRLSGKYQVMSAAEVLEMQKEMAPVLGHRGEAIHMAETMSKLHVALLGTLGEKSASQFNRQIRDAIRAGELSGNVLQPERFAQYLDGMAKTLKAFGGTITPSDYFMATKYGRASGFNWSDEFTDEILPTIMQELGASSTGTALMTMYQAVVGGRMRGASVRKFGELSLIDRSKISLDDLTPEGRLKRMPQGAIVGSRLLMENPYDWAWKHLVPALLDKGIISQAGLDALKRGELKQGIGVDTRKAITETVAVLFGDRTAQGISDMLVLQYKKIERDRKLRNEAMGMDEGAKFFLEKDYKVALEGFEKQWETLMQALGSPNVDTATRVIQAFTKPITAIGQAAAGWPEGAQTAMIALASVARSFVVVGTALLATALVGGPAGWIAVGLLSLVTTLTALSAMNLAGINEFFDRQLGHFRWAPIGERLMKSWSTDGYTGVGSTLWAWLRADIEKFSIRVDANSIMGSIVGKIQDVVSGLKTLGNVWFGVIEGIAKRLWALLPGFSPRSSGVPNADPSTMEGLMPQSYTPGGPSLPSVLPPPKQSEQMIQTHVQLNLDGMRLADAVAHHIVRRGAHPHSGGQFDGSMSPTPVDFLNL
jgi:hypothetical protein